MSKKNKPHSRKGEHEEVTDAEIDSAEETLKTDAQLEAEDKKWAEERARETSRTDEPSPEIVSAIEPESPLRVEKRDIFGRPVKPHNGGIGHGESK